MKNTLDYTSLNFISVKNKNKGRNINYRIWLYIDTWNIFLVPFNQRNDKLHSNKLFENNNSKLLTNSIDTPINFLCEYSMHLLINLNIPMENFYVLNNNVEVKEKMKDCEMWLGYSTAIFFYGKK